MATETTGQTPATDAKQPSTNVVPLPRRESDAGPSDRIVAFVKKHPVAAVAGGLAVGVIAAGLINRKGTRKLAGRAFKVAEMASSAALLFGRDTLDRAETAGSGARKQVTLLAGQAERLGSAAADRAERIGHAAWDRANGFGHAALNQSTRLIGYPKPKPLPSLANRIAEKTLQLATRVRG